MSEEVPTGVHKGWSRTWRWVGGLLFCGVLGWIAFVQGQRVPLLGHADFGFHELGHLLAAPFPNVITVLAGSGLQMAVPLGLAGYFHWRKDLFAASLMLAWAGTSFQDVSVYIADAPYKDLPIIGGPGAHDWAYLLGPAQFDAMGSAETIARTVWVLGLLLVLAGASSCVVGLVRGRQEAYKHAKLRERRETLPVRKPRSPSAQADHLGTPLEPAGEDTEAWTGP